MIKNMYKLSDEDVARKLDQIDQGLLDDQQLAEKTPLKLDSLDKVLAIDYEIKQQMAAIEALS